MECVRWRNFRSFGSISVGSEKGKKKKVLQRKSFSFFNFVLLRDRMSYLLWRLHCFLFVISREIKISPRSISPRWETCMIDSTRGWGRQCWQRNRMIKSRKNVFPSVFLLFLPFSWENFDFMSSQYVLFLKTKGTWQLLLYKWGQTKSIYGL